MAYLDLANTFTGPVAAMEAASSRSEPVVANAGFSALEWSVIALAQNDSPRSLTTPGPLARAVGGLFGLGTGSRLADPQLEALRRAAVYAWRRGFAIPKAEIARFLEAGFSETQLERMVESITGWRMQPRGNRAA